jgi:hypothetical protein
VCPACALERITYATIEPLSPIAALAKRLCLRTTLKHPQGNRVWSKIKTADCAKGDSLIDLKAFEAAKELIDDWDTTEQTEAAYLKTRPDVQERLQLHKSIAEGSLDV